MNIRKLTTEVGQELQRIAKANRGQLTPEAVLKNAASKSSPIHDRFTWDDTEAAHKMRLLEASFLIRSVKVRVEMHDNDNQPLSVRAFVNVQSTVRDDDDDGRADCGIYVPLSVALNKGSYRDQMLANAASELLSFRKKYSVLTELAKVFKAIDQLPHCLYPKA